MSLFSNILALYLSKKGNLTHFSSPVSHFLDYNDNKPCQKVNIGPLFRIVMALFPAWHTGRPQSRPFVPSFFSLLFYTMSQPKYTTIKLSDNFRSAMSFQHAATRIPLPVKIGISAPTVARQSQIVKSADIASSLAAMTISTSRAKSLPSSTVSARIQERRDRVVAKLGLPGSNKRKFESRPSSPPPSSTLKPTKILTFNRAAWSASKRQAPSMLGRRYGWINYAMHFESA